MTLQAQADRDGVMVRGVAVRGSNAIPASVILLLLLLMQMLLPTVVMLVVMTMAKAVMVVMMVTVLLVLFGTGASLPLLVMRATAAVTVVVMLLLLDLALIAVAVTVVSGPSVHVISRRPSVAAAEDVVDIILVLVSGVTAAVRFPVCLLLHTPAAPVAHLAAQDTGDLLFSHQLWRERQMQGEKAGEDGDKAAADANRCCCRCRQGRWAHVDSPSRSCCCRSRRRSSCRLMEASVKPAAAAAEEERRMDM